jgi:hypothetical protein
MEKPGRGGSGERFRRANGEEEGAAVQRTPRFRRLAIASIEIVAAVRSIFIVRLLSQG